MCVCVCACERARARARARVCVLVNLLWCPQVCTAVIGVHYGDIPYKDQFYVVVSVGPVACCNRDTALEVWSIGALYSFRAFLVTSCISSTIAAYLILFISLFTLYY